MLDRQIFSERLKELREKNNMSCASLALQIGVTGASLGYYERGERVPDIETTQKLCGVFGVTSDYLLGLSDTPSPDIEDQAICKKLGIEGETLEALKYIFLGYTDDMVERLCQVIDRDRFVSIRSSKRQNIRKTFSMFLEGINDEKNTNFLESLCKFIDACRNYSTSVKVFRDIEEHYEKTQDDLWKKSDTTDEDYDMLTDIKSDMDDAQKALEQCEDNLYAAEWRVQKGVTSILDIMAERITIPDEWQERKKGR